MFSFIQEMERAAKLGYIPTKLYYLLEKNSVHNFAMEHEAHDDEMEGIRNITRDYKLELTAPLHVKVLYNELKALEASLITHARIENEILFPKAMALEAKIKVSFAEKIKQN